ncbi:amidase family protein [Brachybacterium sp. GPGPB12]|uniref:amidase family protein n=1 Tax=Brachybacterium sp. GPGPB12 TaxID=3023517 RepID=UPI0031344F29
MTAATPRPGDPSGAAPGADGGVGAPRRASGPTDAPLGALATAAALRSGELDPVSLAETALDRARTVGAEVGAFAHVLEELTLAQAREAGSTWKRPAPTAPSRSSPAPPPARGADADQGPHPARRRPLRGRRRGGCAGTSPRAPTGSRGRLLDGGTLTVGKTTTPEFGMPCYTEPATGAPARTPWDLRRTAGGSSGGAAAAVASGIVPIAHGSDGGGSVRIPAACCGIAGLKPSRGLVSPGPHGGEGMGLVTDGVLAREVRDLAAGLDLIAGPRPGDFMPAPAHEGSYLARLEQGAAPQRARIGVLREPLAADTEVHPAALAGLERAVHLLEDLGHSTQEIPAPFTPEQWTAFMPLWTVGAASIPLEPAQEGATAGADPLGARTGQGVHGRRPRRRVQRRAGPRPRHP